MPARRDLIFKPKLFEAVTVHGLVISSIDMLIQACHNQRMRDLRDVLNLTG